MKEVEVICSITFRVPDNLPEDYNLGLAIDTPAVKLARYIQGGEIEIIPKAKIISYGTLAVSHGNDIQV